MRFKFSRGRLHVLWAMRRPWLAAGITPYVKYLIVGPLIFTWVPE